MKRFTRILIALFAVALLAACGGSGGSTPDKPADIVGDGGVISGHSYEDTGDEIWEFGLDGKVYSYHNDDPDGTYFRGEYKVYLDADAEDAIDEQGGSILSDVDVARVEELWGEKQEIQRLFITIDMSEVSVDGEEIEPDKFDMSLDGFFFPDARYIAVKNREFNSPYSLTDLDGGEDLGIDLSMVSLGSLTDALLEEEAQQDSDPEADLGEDFQSVEPKKTEHDPKKAAETDLSGTWKPVETKYDDGYVQGAEEIAAREAAGLETYVEFDGKGGCILVFDNEKVECTVAKADEADFDWKIDLGNGHWFMNMQDDGSLKIHIDDDADVYMRLEKSA